MSVKNLRRACPVAVDNNLGMELLQGSRCKRNDDDAMG